MNEAYLSLGTNIGDRSLFLKKALEELEKNNSVQVVNVSSIYETDPVGYLDQDSFLNLVVQINTSFSADDLLHVCLEIEKMLGRRRDIRWGPRTIDLDILLFNEENIITERLIIPHPRMTERSFVLVPLLEIFPNKYLPGGTSPLVDMVDQLEDREGVRIWKQKNGEDVFALFES